jgi:hypothetical protein
MHKRSELLTHIHNTVSQYKLPVLERRIDKRCDREGLLSHFPDPAGAQLRGLGCGHDRSVRRAVA